MSFHSVLPGFPSSEELHAIERQFVTNALAVCQDASRTVLSSRNAGPTALWLLAVEQLLTGNPVRASGIVRHWSTVFFLPDCMRGSNPSACERLLCGLLPEGLPSGTSCLSGARFHTTTAQGGCIPVLPAAVVILFRRWSEAGLRLQWSCEERSAHVHAEGCPNTAIQIPLPLSANQKTDAFEIRPYANAGRWNVPVIENAQDTLFVPCHEVHTTEVESEIPLQLSLDQVYDIIKRLWPEFIIWIQALVPAFADAGASPGPRTHISGNYDAGLPVYMSRVANPWFHAEDLVHEAQHLRFHFAIPHCWFGRWSDFSFISPYRADPRPLSGLHLGVHAFVAVNELRIRRASRFPVTEPFLREVLRTHRQNVFVLRTIAKHERLTSEGARFYAEIASLVEHQAAWIESRIGSEEASAIECRLERYAASVRTADAGIENGACHFGPFAPGEFREWTRSAVVSGDQV